MSSLPPKPSAAPRPVPTLAPQPVGLPASALQAGPLALPADWPANRPVPSPCISICRIGADGLCEGCWRTLDEIAAWSRMDDGDKRAVWALLPDRWTQAQAAVFDDPALKP